MAARGGLPAIALVLLAGCGGPPFKAEPDPAKLAPSPPPALRRLEPRAAARLDVLGGVANPTPKAPTRLPKDAPLTGHGFAYDALSEQPAARVDVVVDGKVRGAARYGLPSPGLAARLQNPALAASGFDFAVPRGDLSGRHRLQLRVVTSDGAAYTETPPYYFVLPDG